MVCSYYTRSQAGWKWNLSVNQCSRYVCRLPPHLSTSALSHAPPQLLLLTQVMQHLLRREGEGMKGQGPKSKGQNIPSASSCVLREEGAQIPQALSLCVIMHSHTVSHVHTHTHARSTCSTFCGRNSHHLQTSLAVVNNRSVS